MRGRRVCRTPIATSGSPVGWTPPSEADSRARRAAPLLQALSSKPAATFKPLPEFLIRVAAENDPDTKDGKKAIEAAKDAIATWRDPRIVNLLIASLQKRPKLAPRVIGMLSGLPDAPESSADDVKKLTGVWGRYVRTSKLVPPSTQQSYEGKSAMFAAPEMIVDPEDKKWRKDLELPNLQVDSVELAVCVDATGSMAASNDYVTAYVESVMRMLKLLSEQVRGGAVYYRHETDPSFMLQCCKDVDKEKQSMRVKVLQPMSDPKALVQLTRTLKLPGKKGHGENPNYCAAWAAGLNAAIKDFRWSPKSKRIIACTGDDNPTPGSEKAFIALAEKAKKEGILLMFVVRDEKVSKYVGAASKAATGLEPILYGPDIAKLQASTAKEKDKKAVSAMEDFKGTAFETMTTRVVEQSLRKAIAIA